MNRIPKKLREQLAVDPFYSTCCVTGLRGTRGDPIQWHHNLIFAGKQVQARFCILPVKRSIHDLAKRKEIKDKLDWIMVNRMSGEDLELYGKGVDWYHRREWLNMLFGAWSPWDEVKINY